MIVTLTLNTDFNFDFQERLTAFNEYYFPH